MAGLRRTSVLPCPGRGVNKLADSGEAASRDNVISSRALSKAECGIASESWNVSVSPTNRLRRLSTSSGERSISRFIASAKDCLIHFLMRCSSTRAILAEAGRCTDGSDGPAPASPPCARPLVVPLGRENGGRLW